MATACVPECLEPVLSCCSAWCAVFSARVRHADSPLDRPALSPCSTPRPRQASCSARTKLIIDGQRFLNGQGGQPRSHLSVKVAVKTDDDGGAGARVEQLPGFAAFPEVTASRRSRRRLDGEPQRRGRLQPASRGSRGSRWQAAARGRRRDADAAAVGACSRPEPYAACTPWRTSLAGVGSWVSDVRHALLAGIPRLAL